MKVALIAAAGAIAVVAVGGRAGSAAPSAGERAYQKCYSCHATEAGKNDLEGPSLRGIVGRPVAGQKDFDYSPSMRRFGAKNPRWTAELLDRYVADPEGVVPGTRMNFPGMRDAKERAVLIDYLKTLRR